MSLRSRADRIKKFSVIETLNSAFPELDFPDSPGMVCCPLHGDSAPSLNLHHEYFKCFGCQAKGDAISFTMSYRECSFKDAIEIIERAVGLSEDESKPSIILGLSKISVRTRPRDPLWDRSILFIEDGFLDLVLDFLHCRDPFVRDLAWSYSEYVFDVFDSSRSFPPSTMRGRGDLARTLKVWSKGMGEAIVREVSRTTGKDSMDVSSRR